MKMKTINLIDGYGYVFRAHYGLPPMTDPKGRAVGAVFGFCRMLLNLIEKHKNEPLAVVFDSGGKNHRHHLYPAYKSHRPPAPEDLILQFPLVREVCQALGVFIIEMPNQEADDLIATYARLATREGYAVNIVSSDKDLMQLINDRITMYDPVKNKVIDLNGVVEKFGVLPDQVIDVQALMGDSADNIPGIPGVGPKTAAELIVEYGSLDNLYAHVDAMKVSKRKENLITYKNLAYISKELVTLIDMPVEHDIHNFAVHLDVEKAAAFVRAYGFESLAKRLGVISGKPERAQSLDPNLDLQHQVRDKLSVFRDDKISVFADLKATLKTQPDLDPFQVNDLASLSLCLFQGRHKHTVVDIRAALDRPEASETELFKIMYDMAVDRKIIDNYLTCDRFMPFVLMAMENAGITVDVQYLEILQAKYADQIKDMELLIYKTVGMEFNINSPKQLGHILYEKNNFQVVSKTKTGQASTDADTLQKLADSGYELPKKILEYRMYTKILSTYVQPLIDKAEQGKIHSTFSHVQTLTGRLASSNPNLQNIPIRTEDGKTVRQAFVASSADHVLMSFDYSQIELRLLAHYADEPVLIETFQKGDDIHKITAQHLFGDTSDKFRRIAKTVNFGIIYGISAHGLSENLGITRTEAKKIITDYFERYPGIRTYIDTQILSARIQGYVTTITNRPIYITDINASHAGQRQFAERQAANAPLQGSNAELIKRAMVKIHFWLKHQKLKTQMVLQVHDELIFDVPKSEIEVIKEYVIKTMTNIYTLKVPIVVNCGVGDTWLEAH